MYRKIAILGSGSWATALAKIVMQNRTEINWFIRRQEVIDEFISTGKNPSYLGAAEFDVSRIHFSSDINQTVAQSDVLILAIPSPYVKQTLMKIRRDMTHKVVISAVKGMIPDENIIITDYLHDRFGIAYEQLGVIAGPCHAEEIALERLSYLTIGCENRQNAEVWAKLFQTQYVHTTLSSDVIGLEYSSVMKNIYAIAAGMCQALHYGDNFQAVLLSNAIQEIQRFATDEQCASRHHAVRLSGRRARNGLFAVQPQPPVRSNARHGLFGQSRSDGNGDGSRRLLRHESDLRSQPPHAGVTTDRRCDVRDPVQ